MVKFVIEKCLSQVQGHFELVLLATERAKYLAQSMRSSTKNEHKISVISLHEISESEVGIQELRERLSARLSGIPTKLENDASNEILEELSDSSFIEGEIEEINTDYKVTDAGNSSK